MPGKDKSVRAGKSKKALESEFADALAAADNGERCTASESNKPKGGHKTANGISPNYIPPPPRKNNCVEEPAGKKKGKKK